MNNEHYDASDIQVLEGLEAVRKRPGMYIGSTSSRGLHHLVWEIVDNAIDEALAGYCDDIEITINKDGSVTVKDDGRGIPVEIHPKTGLSTVETVYTVLHAGGKFGGGGYKVSGGLHGVGASVVNALSKWVEVTVYKNGKIHNIKFANGGKTVEPLSVVGECSEDRTGTTVSFMPDSDIFTETTTFDYDTLKTRARELAFLNKGLRIILMDDRDGKKDTFVYEGGIKEFVEYLNRNNKVIHNDIVYVEGVIDDISLEVALQYNEGYQSSIYSFVNNIITPEGRWSTKKMVEWCYRYGLATVPVLSYDYILPDTVDGMLQYATAKSLLNPEVLREGVVVRSQDGKQSFKAVSPEYLVKHGK